MATKEELKELRKRIHDVVTNEAATKEDWFALWEEIERCRKNSDYKTWAKFYSTSVIESVYMTVAGYKYEEEQQEKGRSHEANRA